MSKIWRVGAADELAQALSERSPGQAYSYRFDWDEEGGLLWMDFGKLLGASHGFEIPFVFGHFDIGPESRFLFDADNEPAR